MKEYFNLQIKLIGRKFREIGLHPILAVILLMVALIALSIYAYKKTEFAPYILSFIALSFIMKLSEVKRNEFLKTIFKSNEHIKIRIIENLILTIPFLIILLFFHSYLEASLLLLISIIFAIKSMKSDYKFTMPTPYFKKPFEFTIGFRKTFYLIPLAYILTVISISVNNFNLGIFSFLLVFVVYFSYYFKPEEEYFVWSFDANPKSFLLYKIKTALMQSTYFVLPIALTLSYFYLSEILLVLLFLIIGYTFLIFFIVAKYSTYPDEIGIVQGIILAFSIFFPPILLIIIPLLFNQSQKRLNYLLQ